MDVLLALSQASGAQAEQGERASRMHLLQINVVIISVKLEGSPHNL